MSKINQYRLMDLDYSHLELVLRWRNQENIRNVMFDDRIISLDEHKAWFKKVKDDPSAFVKIFCLQDKPLGIVNITKIDKKNNICHWGFYIGESNAPKGSGTKLGFLALKFIFEELKIRKLCAEILDFNERSILFHQKFGFKKEGTLKNHHIKKDEYVDIILMALFSNEWNEIKSEISMN